MHIERSRGYKSIYSKIYTIPPNLGKYSSCVLQILHSKHHQTQREVNNADVRIVHEYIYVVKATTNVRAGTIYIC